MDKTPQDFASQQEWLEYYMRKEKLHSPGELIPVEAMWVSEMHQEEDEDFARLLGQTVGLMRVDVCGFYYRLEVKDLDDVDVEEVTLPIREERDLQNRSFPRIGEVLTAFILSDLQVVGLKWMFEEDRVKVEKIPYNRKDGVVCGQAYFIAS